MEFLIKNARVEILLLLLQLLLTRALLLYIPTVNLFRTALNCLLHSTIQKHVDYDHCCCRRRTNALRLNSYLVIDNF